MNIKNIAGKIDRKHMILLAVVVIALLALFGGNLKILILGPSSEQIGKVLQEKGPKLKIEAPTPGSKLKPEFNITGHAKVPGQYIRGVLKDDQGNILHRQTFQMKERNLDWTSFKIPFAYQGNYRGKAELEVYWIYAGAVDRMDTTKIPVNLE